MSTKRNSKNTAVRNAISLFIGLIVVCSFIYTGVEKYGDKKELVAKEGTVTVSYIDVGQGDSEFLQFPDGKCMLIDAGTYDSASTVIQTIESYGYSKIDYVVATHPHADHIGGMAEVISHFDVGDLYMPYASTTTKTYENLLSTVKSEDLSVYTAKAGKQVYSDNSLIVEFLAPVSDYYEELNNYSAVVKVTYGKNSFLFDGDAEELSEEEMLARSYDSVDCDVLKVGHHGSSTSSSIDFLQGASPSYAIISCGVDNKYGHPHSETLEKLNNMNVKVFRTDKMGTITISCDGKDGFIVEE